MILSLNKPRRSGRAIIIRDGHLLTFLRKRYSRVTGKWIEYYSIPGGGIDGDESPEQAVIRELREEMGVEIKLQDYVAHRLGRNFEHYVYTATITQGEPQLVEGSEEAIYMTDRNQFIVKWVPLAQLTKESLRYYSDYYELILRLGQGELPKHVIEIDAR